MSIKQWPDQQRPREKLLLQGAASLSDSELVAIFLRVGRPGVSAVEMAQQLINHFDGLRGLLEADQQDFCELPGLGPAKYVQLQAVMEMARRHLADQLTKETVLENPQTVKDFLFAKLRHKKHEVFAALLLDQQHRLIHFHEVSQGSIASASVYPRQLVQLAMHYNAAAMIVAHNHPSGVAEPSSADRAVTSRIDQALQLIEVRLLDHLVIGDGQAVSFAERGWL